MNLGKIRTYFFRAFPPTQGLMLFMVWVGIPVCMWSVMALIVAFITFVYLDARWMLGQEQEVGWEKNPAYHRLLEEIRKHDTI